jgi:uncharacterized membrane protein YsdA (DUF1294 family)
LRAAHFLFNNSFGVSGAMISISYLAIALAAFVMVNIVSFLMFRGDKLKAKRSEWRTPEGKLLLAAFIGPYGAFLAMQRYRHKTKHAKFLLVPVFLVLQTGLIVLLFIRYMPFWN